MLKKTLIAMAVTSSFLAAQAFADGNYSMTSTSVTKHDYASGSGTGLGTWLKKGNSITITDKQHNITKVAAFFLATDVTTDSITQLTVNEAVLFEPVSCFFNFGFNLTALRKCLTAKFKSSAGEDDAPWSKHCRRRVPAA